MYYNVNGDKRMNNSTSKLAGAFPLAIIGLVLGANLAWSVGVNSLQVKPHSSNIQSTLTVLSKPDGRLYTTYQTQTANTTPQYTAAPNEVQPAKASVQGNQEDGDIQPALGYGALGWTLQ